MRNFILAGTLASLAIASAANAATITYNDSHSLPNKTDVTLSLPKFDTTLGTLTGVYVSIGIDLKGVKVQMDNDATSAQTGTAEVTNTIKSLTSTVSLLKADSSTILPANLNLDSTQDFVLAATSGDAVGVFNATGLGDYAVWQPGTLTASASGDIASSVWGAYTGPGSFDVSAKAQYITTATFAGDDGYFQANTPNATFYGSVTYTYTLVPEPATVGVMALAGLVFVGGRRRAVKGR